MTGPGPRLMSADSLEDTTIYNHANEKLGELEEIMFDMDQGKVAYGVVEFGGFLGIGTKYFAVPWSAFELDTQEKCLRLDIDKDRLDAADGFDKDDWPDMANLEWATHTYTSYGQTPYWQ